MVEDHNRTEIISLICLTAICIILLVVVVILSLQLMKLTNGKRLRVFKRRVLKRPSTKIENRVLVEDLENCCNSFTLCERVNIKWHLILIKAYWHLFNMLDIFRRARSSRIWPERLQGRTAGTTAAVTVLICSNVNFRINIRELYVLQVTVFFFCPMK